MIIYIQNDFYNKLVLFYFFFYFCKQFKAP